MFAFGTYNTNVTPTTLKKSQPHSYADYSFVDSIALIEMPKKFSFPNMKLYDGTIDLTNYIASYKQRTFVTPRVLKIIVNP